jgi:SAM-dependent methyltransferase
MLPKPKGLEPRYGAQFRDQSIADSYPSRPPYPREVFEILLGLVQDTPPMVLDLGCGTGDIARELTPHVARVHAVDPSVTMLTRGKALPGGQHANIQWMVSTAEEFSYPSRYALVVAAESLHWMDWDRVLPNIRRSLTPQGRLAVVLGRGFRNEPWTAEVRDLIARYSTNREFEPYDLLIELARQHLFVPEHRRQTTPIPFTQTVDDYIESFHSRNGLSRERMGPSAMEFDAQLKALVARYQPGRVLEFELVADLVWGIPRSG